MQVMLERLLRTLLHPKLTMAALAVLHLHAGLVTLVFEQTSLSSPLLWAILGIAAGIVGLAAVIFPASRWLIASSGSLLVVVSFARGMALSGRVFDDSLTVAFRSSAIVGVAMWFTLGYVTFVVWRRLVIPYSVLEQTERRKVPR